MPMQEELAHIVSDTSLVKLLTYKKLFMRGSISETLVAIDICCIPLGNIRDNRGGTFRLDFVVSEAVKQQTMEILINLDDIISEISDEKEIEQLMIEVPHNIKTKFKLKDVFSYGSE